MYHWYSWDQETGEDVMDWMITTLGKKRQINSSILPYLTTYWTPLTSTMKQRLEILFIRRIIFRTDKAVMFNNSGINWYNSSATTSNYIVRRTAWCHSWDTKISSYQSERIQRYFDDNFYYFLLHGAKIVKSICNYQIR